MLPHSRPWLTHSRGVTRGREARARGEEASNMQHFDKSAKFWKSLQILDQNFQSLKYSHLFIKKSVWGTSSCYRSAGRAATWEGTKRRVYVGLTQLPYLSPTWLRVLLFDKTPNYFCATQFFQQGKFHSRRHSCQDRFHSRRDGVSQKGFCQRHWSSKFFFSRISILSDGERATQHKISFILTNACLGLTAVWTRIEMCRDFFVKASLTFFWPNNSSN